VPAVINRSDALINTLLRLVLVLWVIGFLAVACVPMFSGDVGSGLGGLLVGGILFLPWLAVLVVLTLLVWLTNPRGRWR
jgi:hypothetical protein